MRRRHVIIVSLLLMFLVSLSAAQQPPAKTEAPDAVKAAREETLLHIRGLAAKIEALRTDTARLFGLSRLAELVCKEDPEFARALFLKAHEIARTAKLDPAPTPPGTPMMGARTSATPVEVVVQHIARCDSDLAFRIHEEIKKEEERTPPNPITDLRVASSISQDQPDKAAQFAERAAGASVSVDTLRMLLPVMANLVTTQRERTDALFVQVMNALAAEPRADGTRLLLIGSHLFGIPDAAGVAQPGSNGWMTIAGVPVQNILGTRPWTTPAQARFYLETSLNILSRPTSDSRMNREDYAAAYQMHRKAQQFAPDLVPLFAALMERLLAQGQVPPAIAKESTKLDQFTSRDPRQVPEEDAESLDPLVRQRRLVNLLPALLRRGEFDRARTTTADLMDLKSRDAALAVIDFFEAVKGLQTGDTDLARRMSEKLKDHAMRALLRAGVGVEMARQGSREAALQELFSAQREATLTEPRVRSALLLAIASVIAGLDPALAVPTLQEGVTAFNEMDRVGEETLQLATGQFISGASRAPSNPYDLASSNGITQVIHIGQGQQSFRLSVRGVTDFDFTPAFLKNFSAEAERVEAAVAELTDDKRKATALANIAAAYLEQLAQAKKKSESPAP